MSKITEKLCFIECCYLWISMFYQKQRTELHIIRGSFHLFLSLKCIFKRAISTSTHNITQIVHFFDNYPNLIGEKLHFRINRVALSDQTELNMIFVKTKTLDLSIVASFR